MTINKNKIEIAKRIYEMLPRWNLVNKILTDFFIKYKSNTSKEIVLIKIALVNSFYKTNLRDEISLADHIFNLNYLDDDITKGDIKAVERIANFNNKYFVSFASKFCHFHNKKSFPIYDSYVRLALKRLVGWKGRQFNEFFEAITKFRNDNNLTDISFEDVDKFLWLYGLVDKLKNNKKDINREILSLYEKDKKLFESLH